MSNLLLDERPLIVLPSLAAGLQSLDEAVILQQIHYWIEKKQNYRDGRYWVYNSMGNWMQQFPWIKSRTTLTRYFNNLEKKGLLITGNYNKAGFDKTKWYTIDYSALSDFEQRLYRTCTTSDQNLVNGTYRTCTTNTIDYQENTTQTTTPASWPAGQSNVVSHQSDDGSKVLRNTPEGMNEVFNSWTNAWGWPNGIITTDLTDWVHKYGSDIVLYAIKQAAETAGLKKPSKYVASILDRYDREHLLTIEDIKADEQRYKQPKQHQRKQPLAQHSDSYYQEKIDGRWTQSQIDTAVKSLPDDRKKYYSHLVDGEHTQYQLDVMAGSKWRVSDEFKRKE